MSFFGKILDKLGFGSAQAATRDAQDETQAEVNVEVVEAAAVATAAQPEKEVDVISILEAKAAANPQSLNWKTSIVDLLKLIDLDSSYAARKELATELGCPGDAMADSAQMNMWLHKEVLKKIAENGGNVPASLLS